MIEDYLLYLLFLLLAITFYLTPTLIAWLRQHPDLALVWAYNLRYGWLVVGWYRAFRLALETLEPTPPPTPLVMSTDSPPLPTDPLAGVISRLLELPPKDRVLTFRAANGRGVQLVCGKARPLMVRLEGPWTDAEQAEARAILGSEAASKPDQVRLLVPEDALRGLVLTAENSYAAARLVRRLVTDALGEDAERLLIDKDYEDHDARPEIAAALESHGGIEIAHAESGVRVRVKLCGSGAEASGYRLEIPAACLDPRRGQRHRARQAVHDAGWRLIDQDMGSGPDLDGPSADPHSLWGFTADRGGRNDAADAALRLLCTIAEAPVDLHVSLVPLPQGTP